MERTHEEATEAIHAGRESRHPEADLLDKEPISKLCDELGLQPTVWSAKTTFRHLSPCSRTVHKRFRMFGIPEGPNFCGAQLSNCRIGNHAVIATSRLADWPPPHPPFGELYGELRPDGA
jgi:hypothetical protein